MDQTGAICRCDCHITYLDNTKSGKCYCQCNFKRIDNNMDYTKIFEHINKRLDKLELRLDKLSEYAHHKNDKKPHKCPVCDGSGRHLTDGAKVDFDGWVLRDGNSPFVDCKACEGKGIVWG